MTSSEMAKKDPRRLRALMDRAFTLAREHGVPSVFIGVAGAEGDLLTPEFIVFLESALRVEDGIFCMTRERAVLHVADVDEGQAITVLDRIREDFTRRFPSIRELDIDVRFYGVSAGAPQPTAKEILPRLFGGSPG